MTPERFSGSIKMPDEELILDMYNYAIDYLGGKGYEHYEISNFALTEFSENHPHHNPPHLPPPLLVGGG